VHHAPLRRSPDEIVAVKALGPVRGVSVHNLRAYSPDFNPIEMDFAKLKASLRLLAERTRVVCNSALGYARLC
jgi:transposase